MTTKKQPIWQHRELVGYASTIAQAERVIRKTIDVHPQGKLRVFQRDTELTGLPAGFVYSVSFGGKA